MSALTREIIGADEIIVVRTEQGRIALRVRVDAIDISKLAGFEAVRFVDHTKTGVFTEKGCGLTGGGDAMEARQLKLDLDNLPEIELDGKFPLAVGPGKASLNTLNAFLDHNQLSNNKPAEHVDHSKIEIVTADGLSGGGTIDQSVVVRIAFQTFETVPADAGMFIPVVDADDLHGKVTVKDLFELFQLWLKEHPRAIAA